MTNEALRDLLQESGVELYDTETVTENGRKIYRVFITCKEGINLDKCSEVTQIISPIFDLEPPVSGQYYLEVSSPGIERRLNTKEHYKASINELVDVKLINTDRIKGKLVSADDQSINVLESDGETVTINYDDIDKCRTYFEW